MKVLRALALPVALGLAASAAPAQERVDVPSLESRGGSPVQLAAHWFAVDEPGRRPAVVLLHGCGGPHGRNGELSERLAETIAGFEAER